MKWSGLREDSSAAHFHRSARLRGEGGIAGFEYQRGRQWSVSANGTDLAEVSAFSAMVDFLEI